MAYHDHPLRIELDYTDCTNKLQVSNMDIDGQGFVSCPDFLLFFFVSLFNVLGNISSHAVLVC